jgi:NAD(P)-dependent dehydrogenase (short-subunit alcohol dehydrogenase family)
MNKLVLVTGASGGLGRAVSKQLSEAGWHLALVGRDMAKLDSSPLPKGALRIEADMSTAKGAARAFEQCLQTLGRPPNALVNCAGSVFYQPLHKCSDDDLSAVLQANLNTAFFSLRELVRHCLRTNIHGAAVLVSSVTAKIGVPNHELIAAAKAGVEGMVRAAAATYARNGIRINAVAPGLMRTPATKDLFINPSAARQLNAQYPLGRFGTVEDVARAINWLASPDTEWITGQVISVDGGFTAVRPPARAS